jgi:hypothetical protein
MILELIIRLLENCGKINTAHRVLTLIGLILRFGARNGIIDGLVKSLKFQNSNLEATAQTAQERG